MITGTAEVKKGVKYLGDSKFELTLTNLTTNDIEELLGTNGTRVAYQFNAAMKYGGETRKEPESGKLYNVVNGVVESVRDEEPEEESEDEDDQPDCSTCVHLEDWPNEDDNEEDPEKMKKECELGMNEDGETICDLYEPIIDIGDDDGEPEESEEGEEESCETCTWNGDPDCPYPDRHELCEQYKTIEGIDAQLD